MKAIISSVLALCSALTAVASGENRATVTIGTILPLTGEMAYVGQELKRGMELALEDYRELGIRLIVEDDRSFDKAAAITAAQKLIAIDRVDLLINAAVNTMPAIEEPVRRADIGTIVAWDHNQKLASMGGPIFGMGVSTEMTGRQIAEYVAQTGGVRRIGIISATDEFSELISRAFEFEFTTRGGEIVFKAEHAVAETDYRSTILQLKQKGVEGIYAPLFPQALVAFIRQARQLGFTGSIFVGDCLGEPEVEELGALAEGIVETLVWSDDQVLLGRYREKYGEVVSANKLGFVALGYDAVRAVVEAARDVRLFANRRAEFVRTLPLVKFDGYSGETVLAKNGSGKPSTLIAVRGGKLVVEPAPRASPAETTSDSPSAS